MDSDVTMRLSLFGTTYMYDMSDVVNYVQHLYALTVINENHRQCLSCRTVDAETIIEICPFSAHERRCAEKRQSKEKNKQKGSKKRIQMSRPVTLGVRRRAKQ